jgi:hypothetical protein
MKKVIKLTESDLTNIVKRVITEESYEINKISDLKPLVKFNKDLW